MIKRITWEIIKPIWTDHLWPGRKSPIEQTSSIKFMGGYDITIKSNIPTFFGAFKDDECIGVNSGFATSKTYYRSRGLYVFPAWRGGGIANALLLQTKLQAMKEKKSIIWSMPRQSALKTYESVGYIQASEFFNENVEFGPNCFVVTML